MPWFLLLLAILSLVFPPLALILLALLIVGVFAKGVGALTGTGESASDAPPPNRRRRGDALREGTRSSPGKPARADGAIDVRSYPMPPPERLSPP